MKEYKRLLLCLIFLLISFPIFSQDTIILSNVIVNKFKSEQILNKLKLNFKKNFKFSNYQFRLNFKTNEEGKVCLININENNLIELDKDIYNLKLPENVSSKIDFQYFKEVGDFNSPIYLLTESRFRYLKLNEYIDDLEVISINFLDDDRNHLRIYSVYKDYFVNLIINISTYNVLSIEFKLKEKIIRSSIVRTKGTTKYINSTSNYEISDENIRLEFEEIDGKLFLINYENNISLSNYLIKIFEQNKSNNLIFSKNYNFETTNSIKVQR
jgi:hypothetical protein